MRHAAAVLALLAPSALGADAGGAEAPPMHSQITAIIKELIAQPSKQSPEAKGAGAASGDTVVMPAFKVTDNFRKLDQAVDDFQRKLDSEKFTWRDGGAYRRIEGKKTTTELEFRYNAEHNGIELLRISW